MEGKAEAVFFPALLCEMKHLIVSSPAQGLGFTAVAPLDLRGVNTFGINSTTFLGLQLINSRLWDF
jgi:hypothetical protein